MSEPQPIPVILKSSGGRIKAMLVPLHRAPSGELVWGIRLEPLQEEDA